MDEPWGISGPAFAGLYLVVLVLIWVVCALLRRGRVGSPPYPPPDLSLEQVAMLYGARRRTAETVLASMISEQRLRVNAGYTVQAVPDALAAAQRGVTLGDEAVLSAQLPIHTSALLRGLRRSFRMRAVERSLEELGLRAGPVAYACRRWGPILLLLAWIVVGLVRLAEGVGAHRPVTFLVFELILGALSLTWCWGGAHPYTTPAGKALVRQPDKANRIKRPTYEPYVPPSGAPYGALLATTAGTVAALGLAHYPDITVKMALVPPSSGGGGSDGGGSSCGGGGGCGGGGCGG